MSKTFRITPRAAQDLKTIGRYTLRTWGKERRDTYLRDMCNIGSLTPFLSLTLMACVPRCDARGADGRCSQPVADFCGLAATCFVRCVSRDSGGHCTRYGPDTCRSGENE